MDKLFLNYLIYLILLQMLSHSIHLLKTTLQSFSNIKLEQNNILFHTIQSLIINLFNLKNLKMPLTLLKIFHLDPIIYIISY